MINHIIMAAMAEYCEIKYENNAPIPRIAAQIKKAFL